MSARRFIAAATVVIVAVLCAPAALVPVLNSADAIVCLAPIALLLIVIWPGRVRGAASAWIADIDETHPEALSRLDLLDGVGTRRPSSQTPAGGATAPNTDAPHVDAPPAGSLHQ
ncbi:hypothetical protein [Microbacterium proteolyticum]|uniref:hypothetical protein n=1 Tax=Microbacterium proteolyticum TaxID=1572644 RepID=UPI0035C234D7